MWRYLLLHLFLFYFFIIICVSRMPSGYSDFYTRHKLWPMAQIFGDLANPNQFNNQTHDDEYMAQCFNSSQFYKGVVVPCNMLGNNTNITCSGALGVSNDEEAIILMFRGTNTQDEAYQENEFVNMTVTFPGGGTASKFWYDGFLTTWNAGLRDAFFAAKNQHPTYELWVIGWSMGGCLAANAAGFISALSYMPPSNIKLVTFGQPRIGHSDLASRYPTLVPYTYRVTHRLDQVPHSPPNAAGYVHFKNEIWYNNSMLEGEPYLECDVGESQNCSDSLFPNQYVKLPVLYQQFPGTVYNYSSRYGEHWYFNQTGYCIRGQGIS